MNSILGSPFENAPELPKGHSWEIQQSEFSKTRFYVKVNKERQIKKGFFKPKTWTEYTEVSDATIYVGEYNTVEQAILKAAVAAHKEAFSDTPKLFSYIGRYK